MKKLFIITIILFNNLFGDVYYKGKVIGEVIIKTGSWLTNEVLDVYCIDGVQYVFAGSGLAPLFNKNGKLKTCSTN